MKHKYETIKWWDQDIVHLNTILQWIQSNVDDPDQLWVYTEDGKIFLAVQR